MLNSFVPKNSFIHKLPFFIKCLFVSVLVFLLYFFDNKYFFIGVFLGSFVLYFLAKLSLVYWWKSTKVLVPFLFFTFLYHILVKNYYAAVIVPTRIIIAVNLANLITLTSSFDRILRESEKTFFFLNYIKVSPRLPGTIINIVLRTIPLLMAEKDELEQALLLRGKKNKKRSKKHFLSSTIKFYTFYVFSLLLRSVRATESFTDVMYLRGFNTIKKK